jgi:hypothetical protein
VLRRSSVDDVDPPAVVDVFVLFAEVFEDELHAEATTAAIASSRANVLDERMDRNVVPAGRDSAAP